MSDNWIPMDGDEFEDDGPDERGLTLDAGDDDSGEVDERALEFALAAARAEFGDFDADLEELSRGGEAGLPVLAVVGRPNVGK